jgi:hypothetical protein
MIIIEWQIENPKKGSKRGPYPSGDLQRLKEFNQDNLKTLKLNADLAAPTRQACHCVY